jgi:hypothetical protein
LAVEIHPTPAWGKHPIAPTRSPGLSSQHEKQNSSKVEVTNVADFSRSHFDRRGGAALVGRLVNTYIPMDGKIKQILSVVVVICVVVWLLYAFGLLSHGGDIKVPRVQ